jgi:formate transporter
LTEIKRPCRAAGSVGDRHQDGVMIDIPKHLLRDAALFGADAFSPSEIAERVGKVGVAKARLPIHALIMLGLLAGAFIGLGSLFYTIVAADPALPHALQRVLGGAVFSLGLVLVVVAGAELFTGNNLLAMAWAEGRVSTGELLFNWFVVFCANFAGALGLACIVFLSGHAEAYAATYLEIAAAKTSLPLVQAFFSGVMCNVLVCMAVWMSFAGRSVVDKAVAVVFPISAFVAAGFEHSVANMYFIPLGMLLQTLAGQPADAFGLVRNLVPVIAGNLVGGSVLVALVYHVIYRWPAPAPQPEKQRQSTFP